MFSGYFAERQTCQLEVEVHVKAHLSHDARVLFTENIGEVVDFLASFTPPHLNVTIASLADRTVQ
jgi:hypothetical protein